MKQIILLLSFFMPVISMASETPNWEQIKNLEVKYQVLNAIDIVQTLYCLDNDNYCIERNPLFPERPKAGTIIGAKVAYGILHYYGIKKMYSINPKVAKYAEYVSITVQGSVVLWNIKHNM